MSPSTKEKQKNKAVRSGPPPFYWRKTNGQYLLTNDFGYYAWLGEADFRRFSAGSLVKDDKAYKELSSKGFIRDMLDFSALTAKWKSRNAHLFSGPGLHIFVMTLRCNHKCCYCQAGAVSRAPDADMAWPTARKSVDFAFHTTAPELTIEFQGGEPLLNWEVLKKTITYARKKEKEAGKRLSLGLVTNFSLMTEEKAAFLLKNEVSICTSLDGPSDLHNANRVYLCGDSHARVLKWLKYFNLKHDKQGPGARVFKPTALLTVTKASLGRHKEIIDQYVSLGLEDIFVRPLSPIGYAKKNWDTIGYTSADFVAFYGKSLGYIMELNRKGVPVREKMAGILLEKIAGERDPAYLDLACPCGAATGQIAYNVNGDLYTCDEGRMMAWEGDDLFRIGNVFKDSYKKVLSAPAAKACVAASELHSQPECSRCAYSPYCGVCPVHSYATQGALWGNIPSNSRCAFMKGVFGIVFSRLKNTGDREMLLKWIRK